MMCPTWFLSALLLTIAADVHGLGNLEDIVEHILDELTVMKEDIKALQEKTEEIRTTNFVGFSVHSQNSRHYNYGDVVVYDTETYDVGGGYSTSSGQYSCQYSGYYFFSVTVSTNNDHHSSMMLYHEDTNGSQTYYVAAFADKSNNDQGSISYVIECLVGEKVFVKQENDSGGTMDGSRSEYGGPLNAFTGFLIEQIY